MHPRIILAIARKDALDLWLNKATLGGLLYPIFMSLLFLLISRLVGGSSTAILVYNPSASGVAQVVESSFPRARVTAATSAGQVGAAFQSTGRRTPYAVGLIVPEGFDRALRAGGQPQLQLYINGRIVQAQSRALLQAAIQNYARTTAQPQPPVEIAATVVELPPAENAGVMLSRIYAPLVLLLSLIIGTTFVPQLLIEEKERKTLRMLMVTPASFADVLLGTLLVVLVYQVILSCVVVAIQGGFAGQAGLVVLYIFLGGCFSLALGLIFGAAFSTVSAATTVESVVIIIYIVAGIFVGPLGETLASGSPVLEVARALPTYYIADGVYNAMQGLGSLAQNLRDIGVVLGSTVALLVASVWILRRQSAVAAII